MRAHMNLTDSIRPSARQKLDGLAFACHAMIRAAYPSTLKYQQSYMLRKGRT